MTTIAIIGAGIGGMTAAAALARRGFDVRVYEQASGLGEVGAGVQLGPNAVKVLDALGLANGIRAVAAEPVESVSLSWMDGALRTREKLAGLAAKRHGAPYLMAHRADLHRLLATLVPSERIDLGRRCVACDVDDVGAVLDFADGSRAEVDIVVGADGIHSVVRSALFGAQPARFTQQICWRATVPAADVPRWTGPGGDVALSSDDYFRWLGPTGHVICYPIRRGAVLNIFAGRVAESWVAESWSTPSSPAEMITAYAGWDPVMLAMFARVQDCFKWGIHDRDPLVRWRCGRAILMGDAAHPMMPTLAQGAAITMEDGYGLALALASASDLDAGLDLYEAARRPRASRVQLQARAQFDNNRKSPPPPPIDCDWIYDHDPSSLRASA